MDEVGQSYGRGGTVVWSMGVILDEKSGLTSLVLWTGWVEDEQGQYVEIPHAVNADRHGAAILQSALVFVAYFQATLTDLQNERTIHAVF